MPTSPRGVLRLRHWLPGRLRLRAHGASAAETRALAERLGAEWHGWSGSLLLKQPPPLNTLAAQLEQQGWWLEAPSPFVQPPSPGGPEGPRPGTHRSGQPRQGDQTPPAQPAATQRFSGPAPSSQGRGDRAAATSPALANPWEQVTLEVGASLIGAGLGEPLGRWLGGGLAGPAGAAAGSFLGLVLGAVLATESLGWAQRSGERKGGLSQASRRVEGRVGARLAGRLGEEAGALAGLRLGGLLAGPVGASAGALVGTLVVGQLGEDAALHHTEQWRQPLRWLRQTGRTAAGEAASQNLFGLLGGALLQAPGRRAGERLGLYLGRRIDWQQLRPLASLTPATTAPRAVAP